MRLKGKTAVVTGAASGIGREIALTYAREGADVVLVARKQSDDLASLVKQCEGMGRRALPVLADVGDHEQVNRAVTTALEKMGKVDVLVSVAAIRPHKPFWEIG